MTRGEVLVLFSLSQSFSDLSHIFRKGESLGQDVRKSLEKLPENEENFDTTLEESPEDLGQTCLAFKPVILVFERLVH